MFKDKQILWAVDLNISYSDHLAMDNLIKYMTNGNFDPKNHSLEVEPPKDFNKSKKNKKQEVFSAISTYHLIFIILLISIGV